MIMQRAVLALAGVQYTLGYYPGHDLKDGKRHRIQITTQMPDYRIRYKQEYVGQ